MYDLSLLQYYITMATTGSNVDMSSLFMLQIYIYIITWLYIIYINWLYIIYINWLYIIYINWLYIIYINWLYIIYINWLYIIYILSSLMDVLVARNIISAGDVWRWDDHKLQPTQRHWGTRTREPEPREEVLLGECGAEGVDVCQCVWGPSYTWGHSVEGQRASRPVQIHSYSGGARGGEGDGVRLPL